MSDYKDTPLRDLPAIAASQADEIASLRVLLQLWLDETANEDGSTPCTCPGTCPWCDTRAALAKGER